jgi:hypothetical protein
LVCIAFSVPFLLPFHRWPIQSFYQEWLAGLFLTIAFCALAWSRRAGLMHMPVPAFLPFGLVVLLGIQGVIGKTSYEQAILVTLYLCFAIASCTVGFQLRVLLGSRCFSTYAAWVLLAGAVLTAIAALLQIYGVRAYGAVMPLLVPRVYGNLGQWNHLADYVSLGVVSAVYLTAQRTIPPWMAGGILLLLLVVLNLSGTRMVWIYLIAAGALGWAFSFKTGTRQLRDVRHWMAMCLAAFIVVQIISSLLAVDAHLNTVGARTLTESAGFQTRTRMWLAATMMATDSPLFGVGSGNYAWHLVQLSPRLPAGLDMGVTDNAHNVFFHVAAEFGLPGVLLCAGVAVWWLHEQLKADLTLERWWIIATIVIIAAHSLVEYPLWYSYFLCVFAVNVGASSERTLCFKSMHLNRLAIAAATVLAVWAFVVLLIDYRKVEQLPRGASETTKPIAPLSELVMAAYQRSVFAPIVELGLSRAMLLDDSDLEAKLQLNEKVMRQLPVPDVVYRHSLLLVLAGENQAAKDQWRLAAAAYPREEEFMLRELRELNSHEQGRYSELLEYAASISGGS